MGRPADVAFTETAMESGPPPCLAQDYDPDATGSIRGRVVWQGPPPAPISYIGYSAPPLSPKANGRQFAHPLVPQVDPKTGGVADVVVRLRGIEPRRSRPWDHPPVTVEQRERKLRIVQGDVTSRIGFVRRGDPITMVALDDQFYNLHAEGPCYFSLAFPVPNSPLQRRLDRSGMVELSSGAGHFWMRGFLVVDDHPYLARTDGAGNYALGHVPAGDYDLVGWLPNWHERRRDYDPESGLIVRIAYQPPLEVIRRIRVEPGLESVVDFIIRANDFTR
ncbi:MAG: hypothetical protein NZ700_15335 [Gemmataceae bacterium]|nr:hypothetical protein [Gemmataceae bacterium]MDW8264284.1 hypothetical protein [Gemmataceae bacterium]